MIEVFKEVAINGKSCPRIIHKVKMPDYNEKGWYRLGISLNAFCSGKLKCPTKEQIRKG